MKKAALIIFFIFSSFITFNSLKHLKELYFNVSVTAKAELTAQQTELINKYAAENSLLITYVNEQQGIAQTKERKAESINISFNGNADEAFGASYIKGEAPSVLNYNACSISQELAFELFGSDEIIGLTVFINSREYVITGIFNGYGQNAALINSKAIKGFTVFNVSGLGTDKAEDISRLLAICAVQPKQIIYGSSITAAANIAAFVPVAASFIFLLSALFKLPGKLCSYKREAIIFSIIFAAALCAPLILNAIPAWLLPPKLSSPQAWAQIYSRLESQFISYISATPSYADVCARVMLIKCAAGSVLSMISIMLWQLIGRDNRVMKSKAE